jgi:hypothetical protein
MAKLAATGGTTEQAVAPPGHIRYGEWIASLLAASIEHSSLELHT